MLNNKTIMVTKEMIKNHNLMTKALEKREKIMITKLDKIIELLEKIAIKDSSSTGGDIQ